MTNQKSIIIIGAGVAGLCAGIYAQMNGYRTTIFEKHKIPGGLVTAWRRKGYLIDLCVHWLVGSGPGIHLHRYWNEIGLLDGRKFYYHDRYAVYHSKDGQEVNLFCDPDRLKKHWLELSPEDEPAIQEMVDGLRFGIRFNPPLVERYESGFWGWIKFVLSMLPQMGQISKWGKTTLTQLAGRFKSTLLRDALTSTWSPDYSALFMFTTLGFMYKKQAGYPFGGSLPLALHLEKRFTQLGGKVFYQSHVEKILVENDCAMGIRLSDGKEQHADVVISAADGYTTIYKLLSEQYIDKKIRHQYESWQPSEGMVYASAGVNRTFLDIPYSVEGNCFELKTPVKIAGIEQYKINLRIHNHEPGFARDGKTLITAGIFSDYKYWKPFLNDSGAYEAEKKQIETQFLRALEQIFPGICSQVEMCNIATPLTFERITGNWKASIIGWKLSPEQGMVTLRKKLSGLKNFWMIGHWVYPGGGLPSGVITGREVIWKQCQMDKKQFAI